jgi:4-amino-4-deoxychorismate lyase
MSRLIESIRLIDGQFCNLHYHQQRMEYSLHTLFDENKTPSLEKFLSEKQYPETGLYKCRIVYDHLKKDVVFSPYQAKKINRVKLVEDDTISYEFKFEDRGRINRLFALRGDCDDVLIVRRGIVTDCSFSNIVFRDSNVWYTPFAPLLKGTMRQKLIDQNKIIPREIRVADLRSFQTFKIINAMLEFDSPEIEVSEIVF